MARVLIVTAEVVLKFVAAMCAIAGFLWFTGSFDDQGTCAPATQAREAA